MTQCDLFEESHVSQGASQFTVRVNPEFSVSITFLEEVSVYIIKLLVGVDF